ncbi:MAG: hypothetical protein R3A79_15045 [Nannocystaceae bacterium]
METERARAKRVSEQVQAIALALLGLVACLHGEGPARGPSDPSIAGSEAGLLAVTSLEGERTRDNGDARRDEASEASEAGEAGDTMMSEETGREAPASGATQAAETSATSPRTRAPRPASADAVGGGEDPDEVSESAPAPEPESALESEGVEVEPEPRGVVHPGPRISMAKVLGAARARIERRLDRDGEAGDGGWVHYGPQLAIRYQDGRAVEAAMRVPAGLSCVEAARWAGFTKAMAPLLRVDGCAWPGISERHRLARGVAGELARATGVLQIWSTKG